MNMEYLCKTILNKLYAGNKCIYGKMIIRFLDGIVSLLDDEPNMKLWNHNGKTGY